MVAYTGAAMRLGIFPAPVVVDLAGLQIPSQQRPVLRSHDPEKVVGHTDTIEKLEQRLKVSGIVSGAGSQAADEVVNLARNGFPWQASVGASTQRMEFVEKGTSVKVNGRRFDGPVYVARQTTLGEISFVPLGADPGTHARVAAAARENTMDPKFREWLEAKGFDPDQLSDVQQAALQGAWKTEQAPAPQPPTPPAKDSNGAPAPEKSSEKTPTLDDFVAQQRESQEREREISDLAAEAIRDRPDKLDEIELLARTAIKEGSTREQFELALLRAIRAHHPGPPRRSGRHGDVMPEEPRVIEAAVCRAGRLENLEKFYDERTLEASEKYWRNGLGLGELLLTFARRNGYRGLRIGNDVSAVLRSAFDVRAAGSTSPSLHSLSGVLSNVANKFLRMGFESVDNAWRRIAAVRNVSDFKQITSYSLTGDLTYQEVGPGGELHHGTLGATSYTNKADTYGRMIGLDRRDLINDDLGALTNTGRRLGRGGAIKLNLVFWTEFLDNSTFFAAGNNNVITGNSDLALDALESADNTFRIQTDPDGNPLGLMPKILLVPTALRVTALNIINAVEIQSGTDANVPNANAFAGMLEVVSSPYMQDSNLTGNSSIAWYLLADPMDLPVIEVAFLNGVESPTVETADADFGTLGIALRGFHDFGASKQEYRGGVRAAGTTS